MKRDRAIHALKMAVAIRQPFKRCLHHTDRGSQYCSHDSQKLVRENGLHVSMSGKGNCYFNTAVLRRRRQSAGLSIVSLLTFFKTIKVELIWQRSWQARRDSELAIF